MKITVKQIIKEMHKKHRFIDSYSVIGKELDRIIGHKDVDCIGWFHCHCENGDKIWDILEVIDKKSKTLINR